MSKLIERRWVEERIHTPELRLRVQVTCEQRGCNVSNLDARQRSTRFTSEHLREDRR